MIAIVGGGIAGLAAAFELATRQVPFQLFEASDRLGGLVRTEHVDGFTIEAGADSMLAQKPAGIGLCTELGLGDRLISTRPPRTAFVLHRDILHPLPSPSLFGIPGTWRGLAGFSLLSPAGRARVALEPFVARRPHGEESIGQFFRRRFGAEAAERLAQPLIGGIHAGDIDALSLGALIPRLAEAESRGSVLRWVRQVTSHAGGDGAFRSLASGMGELVRAIQQRLPRGTVRMNTPVLGVRPGPELDTAAGRMAFKAVLIAAPAPAAAQMLLELDRDAAALCAQTRYVSTVSVALAWPRAAIHHPLAGTGFVVARASGLRITACTWVSSKFEGRAPDGHALLRAFLGGAHDPSAVDLSDDELIAVVRREIGPILGIDAPPLLARVYRWRNAGAQHDVHQGARVAEIERRLAAHPGLFVAGSGFRTVGVPDCIADGRAVAAAAASFVRL